MNLKKTLIILTSVLILSTQINSVKADEKPTAEKEPQIINIEINDSDAHKIIKEAILSEEAKANIFDMSNINIDETTINVSSIDLTKISVQKVTVLVNIGFVNQKDSNLVKKTFQKDVIINVVDTTSPTINMKYNFYRLDYGEEYTPYDYIESVTDNSLEENMNVWIENTDQINSDAPGTYYVTYFAQDSSGNTTSKDFKMIVKAKTVAKTTKVASQNSDLIQSMLDAINATRAEYGLYALELGSSSALSASAVRASEAAGYCSHTRPNGTSYKTAFDDYNVDYSYAIEILTYSGSTVQDKLDWWMGSSVHRSHILTQKASKIAIGYSGKMWEAIVYND